MPSSDVLDRTGEEMKLLIRIGIGAMLVSASVFAQAQFTLFAAESAAGSLGGNTSLYGGIQQYDFATTGGSASVGSGMAASALHDPAGLRMVGNQLYAGNRWGNQSGQGSVSRFNFDGSNLTFDIEVTGNSQSAIHGIDVNSVTGELFTSGSNNGVRRFLPSGGSFTANGGYNNGDLRDVLVSADGTKIYQTLINSVIRVTDLTTNTNTDFTVSGSAAMHQMALHGGSLYVTSFQTGTVHKVVLDGSLMPVSSSAVVNVNSAIGLAFSPDGQEMFVSGHQTNLVSRFLADGNGGWTANGSIATGHNMGYLATYGAVPEPGSMVLLGLGAVAFARRKRK